MHLPSQSGGDKVSLVRVGRSRNNVLRHIYLQQECAFVAMERKLPAVMWHSETSELQGGAQAKK